MLTFIEYLEGAEDLTVLANPPKPDYVDLPDYSNMDLPQIIDYMMKLNRMGKLRLPSRQVSQQDADHPLSGVFKMLMAKKSA